VDIPIAELERIGIAVKNYIWGQNENGSMISTRKKEEAPWSLNGAAAASFNLDQNYSLTRFILQTRLIFYFV
jgi:hypothetical protein